GHTEAAPEVEEGWIAGPSGGIFLRQAGTEGEPVLLLHGLGGSSDHWEHLLADLSHQRRVAAIDLRGHGRSDAGTRCAAADLATDIEASLDGLGWPRCRIIGHDLGAVAALEFLRRRPRRVEELLLIDPPAARPADDGLDSLKAAVAGDPHRELALQYQLLLAGTPSEIRSSILETLERTPASVLAEGFATLVSYDAKPGFEAGRGRTVCLLSPVAVMAGAWTECGDVPTLNLQSEGHWPMLESYQELKAILLALLNA
ncbi:MAG: alpha/beta fold hydrolase, partial [Thermoanaerobaculia bacterium]|nr:alpha/beta fold hydrolase [Thermoanaerobaculia bacterium]